MSSSESSDAFSVLLMALSKLTSLFSSSSAFPEQKDSSPGSASTQVRRRRRLPPPQLAEHDVHSPQVVHEGQAWSLQVSIFSRGTY